MIKRIKATAGICIFAAAALTARILFISFDSRVISASSRQGRYRITQTAEYASIYDINGRRLNNRSYEYYALVDPCGSNAIDYMSYVIDKESYDEGMSGNLPFLCRVSAECAEIKELTVLRKAIRTDADQPAKHIIGYADDAAGICGIEYSFDKLLRENKAQNKAVFSVNAVGNVLDGLYSNVEAAGEVKAGVITTLELDIQNICESSFRTSGCKKGAIVVMDIKTGEIRACASFPEYNPLELEKSLDDNNMPFINRAFSAYSVGSIFKLVTASAALESGISTEYTYDCGGSINVNGQLFNCHKWGGHGEIAMNDAMVLSCNPYFIALSEYIPLKQYLSVASAYGFGEPAELCDGLNSEAGYLPSAEELEVAAERGNFSFGQGKLSATPLQICRMTAAIANNGISCKPRLIAGTIDGNGVFTEMPREKHHRIISTKNARILRGFMENTVLAENSLSRSDIVSCGGKTSTAQTGRFFEDGTEKLNCWFTGYFPAEKPKYAVTILIEEKNSGNSAAAPVFKSIAEGIAKTEDF